MFPDYFDCETISQPVLAMKRSTFVSLSFFADNAFVNPLITCIIYMYMYNVYAIDIYMFNLFMTTYIE